MAQNYVSEGVMINAAATDPATPASGDALIVGTIPGVAITDESAGNNATGETTICTEGVFMLPVASTDGGSPINPAAVAVGDKLYYAAGVISKDSGGALFGKALGAIVLGSPEEVLTETIPVMLIQA